MQNLVCLLVLGGGGEVGRQHNWQHARCASWRTVVNPRTHRKSQAWWLIILVPGRQRQQVPQLTDQLTQANWRVTIPITEENIISHPGEGKSGLGGEEVGDRIDQYKKRWQVIEKLQPRLTSSLVIRTHECGAVLTALFTSSADIRNW